MTRMREIAEKINAYLKKFEADPEINHRKQSRIQPYYMAGAWQAGRFVQVRYVSFQGVTSLTRIEAEKYLAFLEGGGIGTHYRADVR